MEYRLHPLAEKEFWESVVWYQKQSENVEKHFLIEVKNALKSIVKHPELFSFVHGNKRAFRLKKFPFSIIYVLDKQGVFILAIFHQSRNSKIWKNR